MQVGELVTVTKKGSTQLGHVGLVCCTHETGYLRVYDFMSENTRRWATKDVVLGGTRPVPPPPPPPPVVTVKPAVTVTGQSLSWTKVAGAVAYVFVRKVPGAPDDYSTIAGNAVTPVPVPGQTVRYALRADIDGAAWSDEVSITYPAAPPPTSPPPPPPPPLPTGTRITMGVDAPSDWPERVDPTTRLLKAAAYRIDIGRMPAAKAPAVMGFIRASGASVVAMAPRGMAPTSVVAWARTWGKDGDKIECENETGFVGTSQTFAEGKAYGLRAKALMDALDAAHLPIGVLVQADPAARGTGFIDGLYAAFPNVHERAGGFTVHPYGPERATERMDGWANRLAEQHRQIVAHGAPASMPIYITEYGISTHDGVMLSDNYGWPLGMTFEQAADALEQTLAGFEARPENVVFVSTFQAVDQAEVGDTRTGRELWFGALDRLGRLKGAFGQRVASLAARYRGRRET